MPLPEHSGRHQKAVLWPKAGVNRYNEVKRGAGVEVLVQWSFGRSQVQGPDGTPVTVDAQVRVDREIELGSLMWLGELADWHGTGSGDVDDEQMIAVAYNEVYDLHGAAVERTVALRYFRDTPPASG